MFLNLNRKPKIFGFVWDMITVTVQKPPNTLYCFVSNNSNKNNWSTHRAQTSANAKISTESGPGFDIRVQIFGLIRI